ncbi:transposase, partial [mine drainage metagenome]
ALRLRAAVRWSLREEAAKVGRNPWEFEDDLLRTLGRVERVEVELGRDRRIWYLNLLKHTRETLGRMGYGKLFGEKPNAEVPSAGSTQV